MDRGEAVALLKELVAANLLDAVWVAIGRKNTGFSVEIKSESCESLKEFLENKNLLIEEDKEKGFCIIYQP